MLTEIADGKDVEGKQRGTQREIKTTMYVRCPKPPPTLKS